MPIEMIIQSTNHPAVGAISRKELAHRWHCHPLTIARHEKSGLLKPLRLGARLLRYRLEDIERVKANAQ